MGNDTQAKSRAGVWGAFAADALCLGVHWEYNAAALRQKHGRVSDYKAPDPDSYHKGKKAGDFTHYGDQALVLLNSLARNGKFDLNAFSRQWRDLFADYAGYRDMASKKTLAGFQQGLGPLSAGSASDDLAGSSRIAPLLAAYAQDLDGLLEAAREQTQMTHNNPLVLDSAQFFARSAHAALHGASPLEAMESAAKEGEYDSPLLEQGYWAGLESAGQDTTRTIGDFGSSCHAPSALPGVVHLIAGYPDNLEKALVENAMAGGDSSARGMLAGLVLGASLGMEAIPARWLEGLSARADIEAGLAAL